MMTKYDGEQLAAECDILDPITVKHYLATGSLSM